MKIFDRIREWASTSDEDKVRLDRRAFLKGMAVTSAGLLVPGAAVFDMAARPLHVDGNLDAWDPDAQRRAVEDFMHRGPEVLGRIRICGQSHLAAGDIVRIAGTGTDADGKCYMVSDVTSEGLSIMESA